MHRFFSAEYDKFGVYGLIIPASYVVGSWLNRYAVRYYEMYKLVFFGAMIMLASGFSLLILSLVLPLSVWVPFFSTGLAMLGQAFIYPNAVVSALEHAESTNGTAFIGFAQQAFGAVAAVIASFLLMGNDLLYMSASTIIITLIIAALYSLARKR